METNKKDIGIEFIFSSKFKKASKRVGFNRKLYGYRRYSNHSKYLYIEEGILSNIPYMKPAKSVIIVSEKNSKTIKEFFKTWKIDFKEIKVMLNKEDLGKINQET